MSDAWEKQLEKLLDKTEAELALAIEALKQINKAEINSQRPGGGYSESARISYETLKKLKVLP